MSRFFKIATVVALGLTSAVLVQPASAQRHGGWHGGGWHGGGWGWGGLGLGLGLGLGWELAYAGGPYAYGYYPYPAYPAYPAAYPVYPAYPYATPYPVAAPAPYPSASAPQPQSAPAAGNWYYCDAAKGYYPYVTQCAQGWRAVPSVPPGAPR